MLKYDHAEPRANNNILFEWIKIEFTNIVCLESYWTFNGLRKLKLKMEKQ